jgi:glycine/D-amino acid oxidase-like deaminating enzyme
MQADHIDIAVIGAGSIGIAVAYYLKQLRPSLSVTLIDERQPMSLTSAASGENYRNWWPHPVMKQFMDHSIALLEEIDAQCNDAIINTRSGYVLVSRDAESVDLFENLHHTFDQPDSVRTHTSAGAYRQSLSSPANGADILNDNALIRQCFPTFDDTLNTVVHIRRGGSISTYALGSYMLAQFKQRGGHVCSASIKGIAQHQSGYALDALHVSDTGSSSGTATCTTLIAGAIVNAAGPYTQDIAGHLGIALPIKNIYQQKISFADTTQAVDRNQPFTIDLDPQLIDWTDEERAAIQEELTLARFTEEMPGAIHCRPDGGINSNRIKLGWAYNTQSSDTVEENHLADHFPEIVLRGAARLNPRLKHYYNGFPADFTHYGGYYTMTEENWPLIGKTSLPDYYIATAMSGFGSMAACAAGELTALHITGGPLPDYADALSLTRSGNESLMSEIAALSSKGIL